MCVCAGSCEKCGLAVVIFLPSGGRQHAFPENEVYTWEERTSGGTQRKAAIADHTHSNSHT